MSDNKKQYDNPVSAAMAKLHPHAEAEFYVKFIQCSTIGELFDLTFNFMHVEGRERPINWNIIKLLVGK